MTRANKAADELAKKGAALHPMDPLALDRISRSGQVVEIILKYIACVVSYTVKKYHELGISPEVSPPPEPPVAIVSVSEGLPHEIVWDPRTSKYKCVACWSSSDDKFRLYRKPCPAPLGHGHGIRMVGKYISCFYCGSFSSSKTYKLSNICARKPRDANALTRLNRLNQGRDPYNNVDLGRVTLPSTRVFDALSDSPEHVAMRMLT